MPIAPEINSRAIIAPEATKARKSRPVRSIHHATIKAISAPAGKMTGQMFGQVAVP